MNVVIIDTSIFNVHSLGSALKFLGIKYKISNEHKDIIKASHVILPGIGSFDKAMNKLSDHNLINILPEIANNKKISFLGICLGMQLMCEKSDEGKLQGLGIIKGHIKKLEIDEKRKYKVPNVGFNNIFNHKKNDFFDSIENKCFYFTHSYALFNISDDYNYSLSNHSKNFIAAFQKDNICGTQFHPEKSQSSGLKLLTNFFKLNK